MEKWTILQEILQSLFIMCIDEYSKYTLSCGRNSTGYDVPFKGDWANSPTDFSRCSHISLSFSLLLLSSLSLFSFSPPLTTMQSLNHWNFVLYTHTGLDENECCRFDFNMAFSHRCSNHSLLSQISCTSHMEVEMGNYVWVNLLVLCPFSSNTCEIMSERSKEKF